MNPGRMYHQGAKTPRMDCAPGERWTHVSFCIGALARAIETVVPRSGLIRPFERDFDRTRRRDVFEWYLFSVIF